MVLKFLLENNIYLVGENAQDNDNLYKKSKCSDLWFHLDKDSSPFVILSSINKKQKSFDNNSIFNACQLCKKYSKQKDNYETAIIFTEIKNIKKDKTCKSGEIILKKKPNKKIIRKSDNILSLLESSIIKN